jgi:hypothetical protein
VNGKAVVIVVKRSLERESTHEPSMQAAAKTSGVIWQADEMGAVAAQEATGSLDDMSQSSILPSYPAENSVDCSERNQFKE